MASKEIIDHIEAVANAYDALNEAVDDALMSISVCIHCNSEELDAFADMFGVEPENSQLSDGKTFRIVRYGSIAIMD